MDQSQQPPSHQATRSTYYARRLQQATALLEQAQAAMQQEGLECAAGWRIEPLGSGHLRWQSPSGTVATSSESPSDRRVSRTLRAALRRAGLPCP
jgi:anaerobic glycerol-3-phosphate dehydrogenase